MKFDKKLFENLNKILFFEKSTYIEKEDNYQLNDNIKIKNHSIINNNINFEKLKEKDNQIKNELIEKGKENNTISEIEMRKKKKDYIIENKRIELHTKFSKDNQLRKIKIYPIKFGIDLINDSIKYEFKKQSHTIRNISTQVTSDITINFNNQFFDSSLKKILLTYPINKKYKKLNPDKNIRVVRKLIEKRNFNPITNDLFDMKFSDIINLFIKGDKKYLQKFGIKRAQTFDDFLYNLKEGDIYINSLKDIAYNFMDYFDPRNARKTKKTILINKKKYFKVQVK